MWPYLTMIAHRGGGTTATWIFVGDGRGARLGGVDVAAAAVQAQKQTSA